MWGTVRVGKPLAEMTSGWAVVLVGLTWDRGFEMMMTHETPVNLSSIKGYKSSEEERVYHISNRWSFFSSIDNVHISKQICIVELP
jgi:hypothetical protein